MCNKSNNNLNLLKIAVSQDRLSDNIKLSDFEQRFINDKWYGQFKSTQQLVQYVDNEWKSVNEDEYEFIQQLWMEAEAAEVQVRIRKCIFHVSRL